MKGSIILNDLTKSFFEAINLITSFDNETYGIIGRSIIITVLSTLISSAFAISVGVVIGSTKFWGRKNLIRVINTFMGLPPVVAGLIVFLYLSRSGPLGEFQLLFTPTAMVIAQIIIIFPIVCGITIGSVNLKGKQVLETCHSLGFSKFKSYMLLANECRYPIVSALLAGYGRAISEVGAVMLVGGNIQNSTRVMTTAIVLETGKGNYDQALALGMILLIISFILNWVVQSFQADNQHERSQKLKTSKIEKIFSPRNHKSNINSEKNNFDESVKTPNNKEFINYKENITSVNDKKNVDFIKSKKHIDIKIDYTSKNTYYIDNKKKEESKNETNETNETNEANETNETNVANVAWPRIHCCTCGFLTSSRKR